MSIYPCSSNYRINLHPLEIDAMNQKADDLILNNEYSKAVSLLKQTAKQGSLKSRYALGLLLWGNFEGVTQNQEEAILLFELSAAEDHIKALHFLAEIYLTNQKFLNIQRAIHLLEQGVRLHDKKAAYTLAKVYLEGKVISKNL